MVFDGLKRRINDLEQKHGVPVEFVLRWADPDEDPSKRRPGRYPAEMGG
jgi:hypothetical protein